MEVDIHSLLILILDGDSLTLSSPCAQRNRYRQPLNSGLVGPRAGLGVFKKRKFLVPAGNRTTTARLYSLEHDHYTDYYSVTEANVIKI